MYDTPKPQNPVFSEISIFLFYLNLLYSTKDMEDDYSYQSPYQPDPRQNGGRPGMNNQ